MSRHTPHSDTVCGEATENTGEREEREAGGEPGTKITFGGLSPAEASRRRWEKARAVAQERSSNADADGYVRIPLEHAAVREALLRKAKTGDVHAARELRAMDADLEREDAADAVSRWPKERRAHLRAFLKHEEGCKQCEQCPAKDAIREGTQDVCDSRPRIEAARDASATPTPARE